MLGSGERQSIPFMFGFFQQLYVALNLLIDTVFHGRYRSAEV
jgi:hypothetical protein